ncbi:sugar ABC transporter permease [Paenibacillus macerans]|uniref:Binding--dependent transport system inner membrane component family protein n=1 Tax=Paenibacillus macerans TaxID=44252 RepID=A0A091A360_PAEMA|nr:carbohydrate ABC transporter permease [Paenibacillus macerans]KFN10751.1 binding--dependent transport system inner membrane component family protein [Paenibacillus macerans]MEC0138364.1 carbohydrate ABC transporter permease [Paenibacillus macerans]MEC0152854.1 carbohydrate ABC transporter permease [Paenibacillus macerans]SUA83072.1 binding-protein-dependent transport system inner membrane protein [Paenibacillus macerans]GJM76641.1 sugar ABC transporter permease [Paenibacillus macerans]
MTFKWKPLIRHAFMIMFSLVMIYPVLWWIGASLKTNSELASPNIFPSAPQWSNFVKGWNSVPGHSFSDFYLNTFGLELAVMAATLVSSTLVAFGFGRLNFPLKNLWFSLFMLTLMMPGQVLIIPQYALFHQLGWVNTYWPFIVPHMLAGGAGGTFFVFLLIQFVRGIPKELDESAKIDGCSWFGIYLRVVMPLMKPAIVTVMIFCFLWNWDDFLGHLLYLNSVDKYTVSLALRMINDSQSAQEWGQLLAMSLVSIVPATVIFMFLQKYFVEGIATTGIKG